MKIKLEQNWLVFEVTEALMLDKIGNRFFYRTLSDSEQHLTYRPYENEIIPKGTQLELRTFNFETGELLFDVNCVKIPQLEDVEMSVKEFEKFVDNEKIKVIGQRIRKEGQ